MTPRLSVIGTAIIGTVIVNRPPVFPAMDNLTTVAGQAVVLPAGASDPDGDTLSYDASGLPTGVVIAADTGLVTGTPAVPGIYPVTISTTDGHASSNVSFVWTVAAVSNGRVTFIQARSSSVVSGAASIDVLFPSAQVAGSLNVVVVGWKDPVAQVQSVTDASGNIYQLAVGPTSVPEVGSQSVYYAPNVAGAAAGANSVTVTFTSPATLADVRVTEYQGIEPTNVVDVTATGVGNGGVALSDPATTTFRNDLLFGAVWVSAATALPEAGFTARLTTPAGTLLEDVTVSATGTYTMQASVDPPSPWIVQMVAFRDENHSPVLAAIADQMSGEGTGDAFHPVTFLTASATDPDGDVVTYSATGLPIGLSINANTGAIVGSIVAPASRTYAVTVTASDGALSASRSFTWTIDRRPVFNLWPDSVRVTLRGVPAVIPVTAVDPDGDAITYSATGLPPGVTIDSNTGTINGVPSAAGGFSALVSAGDSLASFGVTFLWDVRDIPPAAPVTLIQASHPLPHYGTTTASVIYASPQRAGDLNFVSIAWIALPVSPSIVSVTDTAGNTYQLAAPVASGSRSLAIYYAANINAAGAGVNTVTVTFAAAADVDLNVAEYAGIVPANAVDVSAGAAGSTSAFGSPTISVGPIATTYAHDFVVAAFSGPFPTKGAGYDLTINSENNIIESRIVSAIGSYQATATIGFSGTWVAQLVAFRYAHAPTLMNPGSRTNAVGASVSLALSAADIDGDALTYTATGLPPGLSLNPTTGVISGTVTRLAAGPHTVSVSVSDGILSTSQTFPWSVPLASGLTPVRRDDFDGDGRSDVITYNPATSSFQIFRSSTNFTAPLTVPVGGISGDTPVAGDFDGDGQLDLGWHRNSWPPTWHVLTAASNFTNTIVRIGDGVPIQGDYDGDGITDVGGFFPNFYGGPSGTWSILSSAGFSFYFALGSRTDIPVPGDYDGDGKTDPAAYRPATHTWRILLSSTDFSTTRVVKLGDGVDIPVPADYDGDGITDVAVYRRATGQWIILNSSTNTTTTATWGGGSTDLPEPGDYDGDGKADLAVFGGVDHQRWLILKSSTGTPLTISSGSGEIAGTGQLIDYAVAMLALAQPSEILRASDFDNDRKSDLTFFRPSNGTWYSLTSSSGFQTQQTIAWGTSTDIPVPGDYDGDGVTDAAFFRPSTGEWQINRSYLGPSVISFGGRRDLPAPADYDGDGVTDLAYYTPDTGWWQIRTANLTFISRQWGGPNDIPVPGDYDGDGQADLALYRASTGEWRILLSSTGYTTSRIVTLGAGTDIPVPGDYDGDGTTDIAVYHKANGQWQIVLSSTGATLTKGWGGSASDVPVPGDYDGDGKTDFAIYRNGTWWVLESHADYGTQWSVASGTSTDNPGPNLAIMNAALGARWRIPDLVRAGDFDGDARADMAVYRRSNGTWYILRSGSANTPQTPIVWGTSTDIPVAGDYDGDGKTDPAYFRSSTGEWKILYSSTSYATSSTTTLGVPGDFPVPGDYDGDGKTDIAVFHPPTGEWQIMLSTTNATTTTVWGARADIPVPADYNGDHKTDLAVYRPRTGQWRILPSGFATIPITATLGSGTDLPVPADYDGDGRADLAVFHRPSGQWEIVRSGDGGTTLTTWGVGTDTPVPGDFDGDGKTDLAIYRGQWAILRSTDGAVQLLSWGASSDTPIPSNIVANSLTVLARPNLSLGVWSGDLDGDGRTDITVYRPSNGTWYTRPSQSNFVSQVSHQWGTSTDIAVPGDYDGDGKLDPAVYSPITGEWKIQLSTTNYASSRVLTVGQAQDMPVPGDYDGDGVTDIAVYRPSTGLWWIVYSNPHELDISTSFTWGNRLDIPVPGDYDGDGKTDVAVYRPAKGQWRILNSATGAQTIVTWGASTDIPVPGDYDGDGRTDIAVYHTANGQWQIMQSATSTPRIIAWGGSAGDIPQPGDYDGDGKTDLAVYRNGTWWVLESRTNYTSQWSLAWGAPTDKPGPNVVYANTLAQRTLPPANDLSRASDFDGDGIADVTVFYKSTGAWNSAFSSLGFYPSSFLRIWGAGFDLPVPGDYDGDGRADPAYYRWLTGDWQVLLSSTNFTTSMSRSFGAVGGAVGTVKPVPGDYDGDGLTDMAVFILATGEWRILTSSSNFNTVLSGAWGTSTDRPVPADYDGDGKTDLAFFRPSTGEWKVLFAANNFTTSMTVVWGVAADIATPGDFDGDGKTDLAVYRPGAGSWYVLYSKYNFTTQLSLAFGTSTDKPVVADFDGDGKSDFGIYTPSETASSWDVLLSGSNYTTHLTTLSGNTSAVPLPPRP